MTIAPASPADDACRQRPATEAVLPRRVQRCGMRCLAAWSVRLGPGLGIPARPE
jgi:hypothetical protein